MSQKKLSIVFAICVHSFHSGHGRTLNRLQKNSKSSENLNLPFCIKRISGIDCMNRVVAGTSFIAFVTHSCLSEKLANQPQRRKRAIITYVDNVGADLCMLIGSLVYKTL